MRSDLQCDQIIDLTPEGKVAFLSHGVLIVPERRVPSGQSIHAATIVQLGRVHGKLLGESLPECLAF